MSRSGHLLDLMFDLFLCDFPRRSHSISNGEINGAENQSAKALQTLKCVMTLKRKLKRMREAKASMVKNGDQGAIAGVGATEAGSLPTTAPESSQ